MGWQGRLVAAVVLVAALLPALPADGAPTSAGTGASAAVPGLALTGYVESSDGPSAVTPSMSVLTTVGVDGVNINAAGTAVGSPDAASTRLLTQAHAAGRRAELLIGNFSDRIGDFDEVAAHRLLTSPTNRAAVARRLVAIANSGWDGIHLDLESLNASDRAGLTAFVRQLKAALPDSKTLAMAVMAEESTADYRAAGYDLPALAGSLDRVALMAYDQHGPGWSGAGPVGGLPWVRTTLAAVLQSVPASQVDLGVAGYGYGWPTHGDGATYTDAQARDVAVDPAWNGGQAEWHGLLAGGGDVWWSDHRSLLVRETLARQQGLHGIAVWSLGQSDPLT